MSQNEKKAKPWELDDNDWTTDGCLEKDQRHRKKASPAQLQSHSSPEVGEGAEALPTQSGDPGQKRWACLSSAQTHSPHKPHTQLQVLVKEWFSKGRLKPNWRSSWQHQGWATGWILCRKKFSGISNSLGLEKNTFVSHMQQLPIDAQQIA